MFCEVAGAREASQGPWLAATELMRTLTDRGDVTTLLQREDFRDLVEKAVLVPAVFLSLHNEDFEPVGTLLAIRSDTNFQSGDPPHDSMLETAIWMSIGNPRGAAIVELMLESGADMNRPCSDRSTPIEFAVTFGGEAAVALLKSMYVEVV